MLDTLRNGFVSDAVSFVGVHQQHIHQVQFTLPVLSQTNSAFYPEWDGKWVLAKVWWCSVAWSKGRYGSFQLWI